jgi:putative ABC transport system permease protein
MRLCTMLFRNLTWFWRTNLAVVAGMTIAISVLAGALLVGDSIRESLERLALSRLGNADHVVTATHLFREELASRLAPACPLIALEGTVTDTTSGHTARPVLIYGVDRRFWAFQQAPGNAAAGSDAFLTRSLATRLMAHRADRLIVRLNQPSWIPAETLHGRRGSVKALELRVSKLDTFEFSVRPEQRPIDAVFVSLARLQKQLGAPGKVNMILKAGADPATALRAGWLLEDLGIKVDSLPASHELLLAHESGLVSRILANAARVAALKTGLAISPVFTYLANSIRVGRREVPYSLVSGIDDAIAPSQDDGITLNAWAARELRARPGDTVGLDYFVWTEAERLEMRSAEFVLSKIVPIQGLAADPNLTPSYPGLTDAAGLRDWDPPFPIDLRRIRSADEAYWSQYHATPKAFLRLARSQQLWGTRFGEYTSFRLHAARGSLTEGARDRFATALRDALDPQAAGLASIPVKARAREAAERATVFGEYFAWFSAFLMIAALLLTGLCFKAGVEQRVREIGLLRAIGFSSGRIHTLFMCEGLALAAVAGIVSSAGAAAFGELILHGLRTWWIGAIGTRSIALHVSAQALGASLSLGMLAAAITVVCSLGALRNLTPRGLLTGGSPVGRPATRWIIAALACGIAAPGLLMATKVRALDETAGFFASGTALLASLLCFQAMALRSRRGLRLGGPIGLGLRNAQYRPGRSTISIALIASATFVIVSSESFRPRDVTTGRFSLVAESALPVYANLDAPAEQHSLEIPEGVRFFRFRMKSGDDLSCLNAYGAGDPRVLGMRASFAGEQQFDFRESLARSAEEKKNPWLLLRSAPEQTAIPAIVDANALDYSLGRKLGDEFRMGGGRFRIVAVLRNSVFQRELIVSEANFSRLFPDVSGYRFFLVDTGKAGASEVREAIESSLADRGMEVTPSREYLARFHAVEDTYLSAFQALGGLGLVLGAGGLIVVVLRNALERRKEIACLRAIGYGPAHLLRMVLAEHVLLLAAGLVTGELCALVAIQPALTAHGTSFRLPAAVYVPLAVFTAGIVASLPAALATLRLPLLASLRSE